LVGSCLVIVFHHFTPGHSTLHQLIEIFHNICIVLEEKKNKFVSLVFCDISKAFDRIWLKVLLRKLESYGIQGDLLKWLRSYLSLGSVFEINKKNCFIWIKLNQPSIGPVIDFD
jgi:hypothetical protein